MPCCFCKVNLTNLGPFLLANSESLSMRLASPASAGAVAKFGGGPSQGGKKSAVTVIDHSQEDLVIRTVRFCWPASRTFPSAVWPFGPRY